MDNDLRKIKNKFGEDMAKLCRRLFPTLLEEEGLLPGILLEKFNPSRSLYHDIISQGAENNFKNFIYNLAGIENKQDIITNKTPKELLSEAGYDLYECHSEKEIQSFRKYYERDEKLCTFNGGRLAMCRVFFAVKKDVDQIKRKDFPNPRRQDKYGTSVISIQFTNDSSHTLSIKNRYNHRVKNPDSTFSNNLDNIIEGLTDSFAKEYGLVQEHKNNGFELEGYVCANDGKYYKYNYEINNRYYCPNNIVIDNFEVKKYEKEKYILMDYFILDLVNKKILLYDDTIKDSFIDSISTIEKIQIRNQGEEKEIKITLENEKEINITLNKDNQIIKIENNYLEKVDDNYLQNNIYLEELNFSNLKEVGNNFLSSNKFLKEVSFPKLCVVGDNFLEENSYLKSIDCPNLYQAGNNFLNFNLSLQEAKLLELKKVGDNFLYENTSLQRINLPKLEYVGNGFLTNNRCLQEINYKELVQVKDFFLASNELLPELDCPNLYSVGDNFLFSNKNLKKLNCSNLHYVKNNFLSNNDALEELKFPYLTEIGNNFLRLNQSLKKLDCPNMCEVGDNCLILNKSLEELRCPNLKNIGDSFLLNHSKYNGDKMRTTIWKAKAKEKLIDLKNRIINANKEVGEKGNKSK